MNLKNEDKNWNGIIHVLSQKNYINHMKISILACAIACFTLTISCKAKKELNTHKETQKEKVDSDTEIVSKPEVRTNWEGFYAGTMPCSECNGAQVSLYLQEGNKYFYCSNYLGQEAESKILAGTFNWDAQKRIITLNGNEFQASVHYLVEKDRLRRLGNDKEENFTDLTQQYDLYKTSNPLVNRHWKLIELNGQKVRAEENTKEIYIEFMNDFSFHANGGCNSIFGRYSLGGKNQMIISNIAMTEMACMHLHYDDELNTALSQTRNFIVVNEDELLLTVGKRAPFAKFSSKN